MADNTDTPSETTKNPGAKVLLFPRPDQAPANDLGPGGDEKDADEVLKAALDKKFKHVVVLGIDQEGDTMMLWNSEISLKETAFLLLCFQSTLNELMVG